MINDVNRRQFLHLSALSAASFSFINKATASTLFNKSQTQKDYARGLFPIALMEDAGLLAFAAGVVESEPAQLALLSTMRARPIAKRKEYYHPGSKGRVSSPLPLDEKRRQALIKSVMSSSAAEHSAQRISLCFGWSCKMIASRALSAMYMEAKKDSYPDIQRAHDASILRQYVDFSATEHEIAYVLNAIHPRTLLRIHTLSNNSGDTEWIHRMSDYRRQQQEHNKQLAKAIAQSDSVYQRQYVKDPNFLNPQDELMSLLNQLRKGEDFTLEQLIDASKDTQSASIYTKAVISAMNTFSTIAKDLPKAK